MTQKSKIAVIGLGNIGTAVAINLVKGSRSVIIADRSIEKANALSQKLGNLSHPLSIPAAIDEADIIVFAIWFDAIKELFNTYAKELQGKIIVDPSNPIAPDEKGGFKKIIDKDQSAGQILSSLLPKNTKLAKALGTLGAASLANAAFQQPEKAVEFYATDDKSIDDQIEELKQWCKKIVVLDPMATTSTSAKLRLVQMGTTKKVSAAFSKKLVKSIEEVLAELKGEG